MSAPIVRARTSRRGGNLRGAYLIGANFRGADLHGANLGDADLAGWERDPVSGFARAMVTP